MSNQAIASGAKRKVYLVELPFTIIDPVQYQHTISAICYSYDYIIELLVIAYVNGVLVGYEAEDYIEDFIHHEYSYDCDPHHNHDLLPIEHDVESTITHELINMYHQAFDLFEYEFLLLDGVDVSEAINIDVRIDHTIKVIVTLE